MTQDRPGLPVVTVDAPVTGLRNSEQRAGFRLPAAVRAVNLDGMAMLDMAGAPGRSPVFSGLLDHAPGWGDIEWLRRETPLPILLKGILHPDDARRALACGIDCMMSTLGGSGISNRPMSNNGDVDYDGDSWFFSYENTGKVTDIGRDPQVSLSFTEPPGLLGKPGIFISIEGKARLIRDKAQFERHWMSDLERWFPEGIDTPGLVLINVRGNRVQYWDGEENGVISV